MFRPTHRFSPALLVPCLIGAMPTLVLAQGIYQPPLPFHNSFGVEDLQWPTGYAADVAGMQAMELGDLDGDLITDALILNGGWLVLVPSFGELSGMAQITVGSVGVGGVTDFCLLDRAGLPPLVAVADSNGLRLLAHNDGAEFTQVYATGPQSGWENARQLLAADQDGDGVEDLLGLTSDGTQVLCLEQTPGATFVPGATYNLNAPATDFTPVAWDDPLTEPSLEVAYVSLGGLEVVDPGPLGPPLFKRVSIPLALSDVEALQTASGGVELLAWTIHSPALKQPMLLVLQSSLQEVHLLGSTIPVGMDRHDFDSDGDTDLVVRFTGDHQLLALSQADDQEQGFTSYFDLTSGATWIDSLTTGLAVSQGNLQRGDFADLTGNGTIDYALPCMDRQAVTTVYGPLDANTSSTATGPHVEQFSSFVCMRYDQSASTGFLKVEFEVSYPSFEAGTNAWWLAIWKQETRIDYLTPESICASVQPNPAQPGTQVVTAWVPPRDEWVSAAAAAAAAGTPWGYSTWEHTWADDTRVFQMLLRPFQADDPADPESAGSFRGSGLLVATSLDELGIDALSMVDEWTAPDPFFVIDCSGFPPIGNQPLGRVKPPKRGTPPPPGELVTTGGICLPTANGQ